MGGRYKWALPLAICVREFSNAYSKEKQKPFYEENMSNYPLNYTPPGTNDKLELCSVQMSMNINPKDLMYRSIWSHGLEKISKTWPHIENLFESILAMNLKKPEIGASLSELNTYESELTEFYSRAAELVWLIGNTQPLARGSGTVAEIIFAVIHLYHDLQPPILKVEFPQLDVLDITFPLDDYKQLFPYFFEPETIPPHLRKDLQLSSLPIATQMEKLYESINKKNQDKESKEIFENPLPLRSTLSENEEESNPARKGLSYLTRYPSQELYRMVVDGVFHQSQKGWVEYEKREEGCLEAVFTGLGIALSNLEETSLSEDLIKRFHVACFHNVKNLDERLAGIFRKGEVGYKLKDTNTTIEGLIEILNNIETQNEFTGSDGPQLKPDTDDPNILKLLTVSKNSLQEIKQGLEITTNAELAQIIFSGFAKSKSFIYVAPKASPAFDKKIKDLIANYNQHIQSVSADEKLKLIIETVTDFERLHPFYDANIRTFGILLLNRLLIQNGFPPATQADPNRLDGYSKDQLLQEIKKSIENTEKLLSGENKLFNFDTSTLSPSNQLQHLQYSQSLINSINKEAEKFKLPHLQAPEPSSTTLIYNSLPTPVDSSQQNKKNIAVTTPEIDKPKISGVRPISSAEEKKISFAISSWESEIRDNQDAKTISRSVHKLLENNIENLSPDNKPNLFKKLVNVIDKTLASPLYKNIRTEDFNKLITLIENKKPDQNDNTHSPSRRI